METDISTPYYYTSGLRASIFALWPYSHPLCPIAMSTSRIAASATGSVRVSSESEPSTILSTIPGFNIKPY